MINFCDWALTACGGLAQQFDHLSRRLDISGDFPAGWSWDALIQVGSALDIVALSATPNGYGVELTRGQLSVGDAFYSIQLRGTSGERVRHTNVVQVYIPVSLSGDSAWPTVPTEFTQIEERIKSIAFHPPVPGENGFWMLWDEALGRYAESQFRAIGEDGYSPEVTVSRISGGVDVTAKDKHKTTTATVYDGGGGGDIIDDTSTAKDKVWSAQKVNAVEAGLAESISSLSSGLSSRISALEGVAVKHINDSGTMTPGEFNSLPDGLYYIALPIHRMSGDIGIQGLASKTGDYVNSLDFGLYFSDFSGSAYTDYGAIDGFGHKDAEVAFADVDQRISALNARIDDVELFKFPNLTIVGSPAIAHGQASDFSAQDYLQFPFLVDFRGRPFVIDMSFTTAQDVATQQNILDSNFGLAFAVANGHFLMALSTDGVSWNLGATSGTYQVQPNTTYYVRISWNRIQYKVEYSLNKTDYTQDIAVVSTQTPYPKTMYVGVGDLGRQVVHVFKGTINLNHAKLTISEEVVWTGMDDAGLASRLAVDLSNIDPAGEARIREISGVDNKQDNIGDLSAIRDGASKGATAYQKPSNGIPASDISNGAITSVKLGSGAVTSVKIAKGAVTADKIADGVIPSIVSLTQAEYDRIETPDPNTIYIIVEAAT